MVRTKPVTVSKFKGIYTKGTTPPEDGTYFKAAQNFDVDRRGYLTTRPGYTLGLAGDFHSLYPLDWGITGVKDNDLVIVTPETAYSVVKLLESVGEYSWYFATAGPRVYGSNYHRIGYIEEGQWNELPSVTDTYKHKMPPGKFLETFKGRLYLVRNNLVIYSDPAAYHMLDIRDDRSFIQMPSDVTMIKGVKNGMWISDSKAIYFMQGDSPTEFTQFKRADYPAIEGTAVWVPYLLYIDRFPYNTPLLITTTEGICLASEDGTLINLTDRKYAMPTVHSGSSVFRRQGELSQYISIVR